MAPARTGPARDGLVGSLLHGLQILDMFERGRTVIGIGEMAQHLGMHRSTASRLAATLASAGYLEVAGEAGRYRLSGKLAALGDLVAGDDRIRQAALPALNDLVKLLGETGHLAVLEGDEAVTVEIVDGWHTVRMHSWVGKRSPAHCSSTGKALLAGLTAGQLRERYPRPELEGRTAHTITDRDRLEEQLARIRESGYAVDLEELEEGLSCVAAPVLDRSGAVVAGISLSGPTARITAALPGLSDRVRAAARAVAERI